MQDETQRLRTSAQWKVPEGSNWPATVTRSDLRDLSLCRRQHLRWRMLDWNVAILMQSGAVFYGTMKVADRLVLSPVVRRHPGMKFAHTHAHARASLVRVRVV